MRPPDRGSQPLHRAHHVRGGHRVEARVTRDRTPGGTGAGAGRVLVAEQHGRDSVRRPPDRRYRRSKERHHGRTHRSGEMRRPGVRDDHGVGPLHHGSGCPTRCDRPVDRVATGNLGGEPLLVPVAGDHHGQPASTSASRAWTQRSDDHARAGTEVPGCRTT